MTNDIEADLTCQATANLHGPFLRSCTGLIHLVLGRADR